MESYYHFNYIFVRKHTHMHDTRRFTHTRANNSVSVKAKVTNFTWNYYPYGKVAQVTCECIYLVCHKRRVLARFKISVGIYATKTCFHSKLLPILGKHTHTQRTGHQLCQ